MPISNPALSDEHEEEKETLLNHVIREVEEKIQYSLHVLEEFMHHEHTRNMSHGIGGSGNYRHPSGVKYPAKAGVRRGVKGMFKKDDERKGST